MNLWLLTEERPKTTVLKMIVDRFCSDHRKKFQQTGDLKIIPILKDKKFTFVYELRGFTIDGIDKIFIKIVSGDSSFVDYLLFLQEAEPDQASIPIYAIEETKTDDSESRNTGVYQRCTKFVYVDFFYPNIKKIMLYNLQIKQKEVPTQTNIFGTRMLRTIGVDIMGKVIDDNLMKSFQSVGELIAFKDRMSSPRSADNVPIKIKEHTDKITVSGKLIKNESLSHDPNIGALSIIALCLRKLNWEKPIEIILHGLQQGQVGIDNKFIKICNKLQVSLEDLKMPIGTTSESYWHYEKSSEKLVSIFAHLIVENYTGGKAIYENHAGSERGYLYHKDGTATVIPKYQEGKAALYKAGDKTMIINIPDIIFFDDEKDQITDVEAKKYSTIKQGIADLKNYDYLDNKIIGPEYEPRSIARTLVIFGAETNKIKNPEISLLLNDGGEIVLGPYPSPIIKEAVSNLLTSQ